MATLDEPARTYYQRIKRRDDPFMRRGQPHYWFFCQPQVLSTDISLLGDRVWFLLIAQCLTFAKSPSIGRAAQ